MIVADASAIVDRILRRPRARAIDRAIAGAAILHVPEHFHVEALSAFRHLVVRGELSARRAELAIAALARLRVMRHPVMAVADTIWELRDSLSAYDAAYLGVARRLDATLVTLDRALADVARAEERLFELT
jgi:predicted nucleic acid-binding protein